MKLPRRRSAGAAAAGGLAALLTVACNARPERPAPPAADPQRGVGEIVAPAGELAPRLRVLPIDDPRVAEVGCVVHGAAVLTVAASGTGAVDVEVHREGVAIERSRLDIAGGSKAPATIPLPGSGTRALLLRVTTAAGARLEELQVTDEAPRLPAARRLSGALRGRTLVLVACDALAARHLSGFGAVRDTSPNADRLAKDGVRFTSMRSQTSWTSPSVATLLTGLEQEQHGVRDVRNALDADVPTLAEAFRAAGYATAAFVQNLLVNEQLGFARGFDAWQAYGGERRALLLDELCAYLSEPRAGPDFVYVHLLPPHSPYAPPGEFASRFGRPDAEIDGSDACITRLTKRPASPSDPAVERLAALYDNNVAYADHLLGEVVRAVEARGREKAAVVFLSDHGEAFAEHGLIGHLVSVFDEMVHVPLVVWAPGSALPAGATVSEPVWMPDLFPSLAELFGLESSAESRASSFVGLIERARTGAARESLTVGRDAGIGASRNGGGSVGAAGSERVLRFSSKYTRRGPRQRALLFGRYKLVAPAGDQPDALFDLGQDPGETRDVSADHPVIVAALRGELALWIAEGVAESGRAPLAPDEALRQELRALGYADDENGEE